MAEKRSVLEKLRRGFARIRREGFLRALQLYLRRIWIDITPFYYIQETLPAHISSHLAVFPEGFEFSVFGPAELAIIGNLPEEEDYGLGQDVIDILNNGDMTLGFKYQGKVVAFTRFSVGKTQGTLYPSTLKTNEAYLYDMYVLKAFRGRGLAPVLRYKNYEVFRSKGIDTFYSVTECHNAASLRFKEKLGARKLLLVLYIGLFNKFHLRWVLKRYETVARPGS